LHKSHGSTESHRNLNTRFRDSTTTMKHTAHLILLVGGLVAANAALATACEDGPHSCGTKSWTSKGRLAQRFGGSSEPAMGWGGEVPPCGSNGWTLSKRLNGAVAQRFGDGTPDGTSGTNGWQPKGRVDQQIGGSNEPAMGWGGDVPPAGTNGWTPSERLNEATAADHLASK